MNQIDQAIHYYKQQHSKVLNDIRIDEAEVAKIDSEIAVLQQLIDQQTAEHDSKVDERKEIQKALECQRSSYKDVVSDVRSLLSDINRKTSKNMRAEAKRKPAIPNRSALTRKYGR
ncbi:hypothetical protein P9112_008635 [Eukaryota sp. TZLM1-RC]